jgi:hypothetical protein
MVNQKYGTPSGEAKFVVPVLPLVDKVVYLDATKGCCRRILFYFIFFLLNYLLSFRLDLEVKILSKALAKLSSTYLFKLSLILYTLF